MADLDLSVPENIFTYLADGAFASSEAIPLFGPDRGANYTFRLILHRPYNGKHSVVLKHGKPHLSRVPDFPFDLARQRFEVEAMRAVKKILPADALVTVPEIYLFDEKANAIIMEDNADVSSVECTTLALKELYLAIGDDCLTESSARTIGSGIGTFLATVHRWGSDEAQGEVLEFFDKNQQGRKIFAWANFDRYQQTLGNPDSANLPALTDPPFPITPSELDAIQETGKKMSELVLTARDTLTHGDFWPGNMPVLVRKSPEGMTVEKIFVIDWELVRPGFYGFELGQFLAELHQAQTLGPSEIGANVTVLRAGFLNAYKEVTGPGFDMEKVASVATAHMGGHLVSWTPRVWKWAEKEKIRGIVADGVNFLLNYSSNEVVKGSPLGILTSDK